MAWTLLTFAEAKIVRLAALGCSNQEIAAILGIKEAAACEGRADAMRKLGVHSAGTLARVATTLGFTSMGDKLTEEELDKLAEEDTAIECEVSQAPPERRR